MGSNAPLLKKSSSKASTPEAPQMNHSGRQWPDTFANDHEVTPVRISILLTVALFLIGACQSSGPAKVAATANAQASSQSNSSATLSVQPNAPADVSSAVSPTTVIATAGRPSFTDADFAKHVSQLKARIKQKLATPGSRAPLAEFSIVIQKPFVVVGDEPREAVQQHADGTVKWAVERLKQDFFTNDPSEILDIWLFKDAASYEKNTRLLFGDQPTTPYGYYSSQHKALIMNISTGGGTLVHELVHPFMEANFPACPPWLNEGLGSLYEQCGDRDGHIHGFTNWRLPGLQKAIKSGNVPPFKTLTAMDTNAFYNEDKGVNYAQARYLCYYLQEKGVLVKFYQEFQARQKEDATGFGSLQKVLSETDMDAFKTKWEEFVMGLRQGYAVTVQ
jgi:hypothetical protein